MIDYNVVGTLWITCQTPALYRIKMQLISTAQSPDATRYTQSEVTATQTRYKGERRSIETIELQIFQLVFLFHFIKTICCTGLNSV